MNEPADRMRIDVWLWRARFFKTRTLASDAVAENGARIERDGQVRRIDKASVTVQAGDRLSFAAPSGGYVVAILSLPHRRGPPAEAAQAYEVIDRRQPDRSA